jgi:ferredoxin
MLPPPMAGFFEFALMRVRGDIDQHALSALLHEYLDVEEDFIKALFTQGETHPGRVFVHETALPASPTLHVLDHERASHVARSATAIGVGMCFCRHKMAHVGRACDAPMDICMTFGATAASLIRHGYARRVEADECLDLLDEARGRHLVQFGENVREGVNFICNCCGCCCEAMIAARRFGFLHPVHTSNYLPAVAPDKCHGCGKCTAACPVDAMSLVSAHDPRRDMKKVARLDAEACLGCGVCVGVCPQGALTLTPRPERVITPLDSAHRIVMMAIERGKLQELVFDDQAFASHRAMAAILGAILQLPPLKQLLATQQLRSRYLGTLIGGVSPGQFWERSEPPARTRDVQATRPGGVART